MPPRCLVALGTAVAVVAVAVAANAVTELHEEVAAGVAELEAVPLETLAGWAAEAPCSPSNDPFCDSGCSCTEFCDGKCAINATAAQNITLYRMTMAGVYTYAEKNTGDVLGDLSFVLSTRVRAYQCRTEPTNPMCTALAKFNSMDANSTDVILEVQMEVDGQWGPYLLCNPMNTSDPLGKWACLTTLNVSSSVPVPASCSNAFNIYPGNAFNFLKKPITLPAHTVADCCAFALAHKIPLWNFYEGNATCVFGTDINPTTPTVSVPDGIMAFSKTLAPPPCNCSRVFKTVGRENLTTTYGPRQSVDPVGGVWYSHPAAGQCSPGAKLGDGGCTWRAVTTRRAIHAPCMYATVDTAVEKMGSGCFGKCPTPLNRSSLCYLECFTEVVAETPPATLGQSWTDAFNNCPPVTIPPTDYEQYMHA